MEDTAPVEEASTEETQVEETPSEEAAEESSVEGQSSTDTTPKKEASPPKEAFETSTFKLKVNGEEVEVSGKKLMEAYQRGESGAARLREAADLRKQVEGRENQLRAVARELSTPEGFYQMLLAMDGDPISFLGKVATLAKEEAKLSPEQRELRDLKAQKQVSERQRAEQERKAREQAEQAQIDAAQDAYEDAFEDEMDTLGVPEDDDIRDDLLVQVARLASAKMEEGEDPYVDDLVKEVWEKYQSRYEKIAPKTPAKPSATAKPSIPGTRTAAPPKATKSSERLVYKSGSSFEDLLKSLGS